MAANGSPRRPGLVLAGLSIAFLTLFVHQRQTSTFLRTEWRSDVARKVASATGVALEVVMALHLIRGGTLHVEELAAVVRRYEALRAELGSPALAALALDDEALARGLLAGASGNGVLAETALRQRPEGIAATRLESVAASFRTRGF